MYAIEFSGEARTHVQSIVMLMPRTQYHVYYVVRAEDRRVLVHAVWHAKRGHGPQLGT